MANLGAPMALRRRRRERRDPSEGLFASHRWIEGDTLDPAAFGNRTQPVAFRLDFVRDAGSNGILFELGGATVGLAAWITADGDLGFGAGDGTGDGGASVVVEDAIGEGRVYRCLFACRPATGEVQIWIDGQLAGSEVAADGAFTGSWAGTGTGLIADVSGTATSRVPVGQRVTLADASIASPLYGYANQFPAFGG